jgi:Ribbon-helix-helix protein, copG family
MTDDLKAEMDWEHAEVAEGKPHGVAISVRLDAAEADRLRSLAASLHLNMSQVLRRALAEYDHLVQAGRRCTDRSHSAARLGQAWFASSRQANPRVGIARNRQPSTFVYANA